LTRENIDMYEAKPTEQLGNEVSRLREQRGLSIRRLADAADVDATWLSRLERGLYDSPDPRLLRSVAEALGAEATDLFIARVMRTVRHCHT
jgi:transcriptional regulator with XRE-family HTH domain